MALDCFSASISNSACSNYVRKDALTYATSFGFFQSFMLTIAGYCLGSRLRGIGDKSEKVGTNINRYRS